MKSKFLLGSEKISIQIFLVGFPRTQKQYESIWVIGEIMTKSVHFIPFKSTYSAEDYARIFIEEIVSRQGIPLSIILDKGEQFTSKIWRSYEKGLGSKVKLGTNFHPTMDGQAECFIKTLEAMRRSCIIYFK